MDEKIPPIVADVAGEAGLPAAVINDMDTALTWIGFDKKATQNRI